MNPLISESAAGLTSLCRLIGKKFNLDFGVPEVVLFEYLLFALQTKAPLEFNEYMVGLTKRSADLDELRNQLVDTLALVSL